MNIAGVGQHFVWVDAPIYLFYFIMKIVQVVHTEGKNIRNISNCCPCCMGVAAYVCGTFDLDFNLCTLNDVRCKVYEDSVTIVDSRLS